jgi:hypothetical protein
MIVEPHAVDEFGSIASDCTQKTWKRCLITEMIIVFDIL